MNVTAQPAPKTYNLAVTLSEDDVRELTDSLSVIPENLVAVRELVTQITGATS